jgi:hypothetical protein
MSLLGNPFGNKSVQKSQGSNQDAPAGKSTPQDWANTNENLLYGVGIDLHEDHLTVTGLTPGCSAEKCGSVAISDEVVSIDGLELLTVAQAKQKLLGKQGSYATVTFQRVEGETVRTFKLQLMRGAPDYIFLAEALRNLETQNARLLQEKEKGKKEMMDQETLKGMLEGNVDLLTMIKSYKHKLSFAEEEIMRLHSFEEEVDVLNKQIEALSKRVQILEKEREKQYDQIKFLEPFQLEAISLRVKRDELENEIARLQNIIDTMRERHLQVLNQKDGKIIEMNGNLNLLEEVRDSDKTNMPCDPVRYTHTISQGSSMYMNTYMHSMLMWVRTCTRNRRTYRFTYTLYTHPHT